MHIELTPLHMIGHWEASPVVSQCEFQFGTRLIYVQHPSGEPPETYLRAAQSLVQAAWDDIENAIAFARQSIRPRNPKLWQLLDADSVLGSPLEVFSILIALGSNPSYTLSWNPDFNWQQVVYGDFDTWKGSPIPLQRHKADTDLWLSVTRVGPGHFELD